MAHTGWVAGINHGAHDAAVVLLHEGQLVVWVELERITRTKRAVNEPPAAALSACLDFAGIDLEDLDCIALGSDHDALAHWLGIDGEERRQILPFDAIGRLLPFDEHHQKQRPIPPILPLNHHLCHSASAYFASGFSSASSIVMDAMGEDKSTTLSYCIGNEILNIDSYGVEESLGFFYEAASEYCGLGANGAGKLMGLAAYGQPTERMPLSRQPSQTGQIWALRKHAKSPGRAGIVSRTKCLLDYFSASCYPYKRGLQSDIMAYSNFARSVQAATEICVADLINHVIDKTRVPRLILSGGVALNCAVNGYISQLERIEEMYVQPCATDSGVALGAAYIASRDLYGDVCKFSPMKHAYWGLADSISDVRLALERHRLPFEQLNDEQLVDRVATLIASGKIVAWHQGRAEVGPRALGARSLLGDPRDRETLVKLNEIKNREMWRPLAPSILDAYFDEYFVGQPNAFMIVSANVRSEKKCEIPAAVHVDGSARPQVVSRRDNPKYAMLLDKLLHLTGVPITVNTSLNSKDQPICQFASNSIDFFLQTDVAALAIENFLVVKE